MARGFPNYGKGLRGCRGSAWNGDGEAPACACGRPRRAGRKLCAVRRRRHRRRPLGRRHHPPELGGFPDTWRHASRPAWGALGTAGLGWCGNRGWDGRDVELGLSGQGGDHVQAATRALIKNLRNARAGDPLWD